MSGGPFAWGKERGFGEKSVSVTGGILCSAGGELRETFLRSKLDIQSWGGRTRVSRLVTEGSLTERVERKNTRKKNREIRGDGFG